MPPLRRLDAGVALGTRPHVLMRVASTVRETVGAETGGTSRTIQREATVKIHEGLLASRTTQGEYRLDDVFPGASKFLRRLGTSRDSFPLELHARLHLFPHLLRRELGFEG